jgi:hypothetical protein
MNRLDALIDKGADRLQELANRTASNGKPSKLSQELADDAAFLRKLKPSLVRARIRGNAPKNGRPTPGTVTPSAPKPAKEKKRGGKGTGGPNPLVVIGAAFAAGIVLAKIVDWRGHAHPRD